MAELRRVGLAALLAGAVACGAPPPDGGDEERPPPSPEPCLPEGAAPGTRFEHVVWQGYWYSRYNLGALTMQSGNGAPLLLDPGAVDAMVAIASDSQSVAAPPAGAALLRRVFDDGDPRLAAPDDGDPGDLADGRWVASGEGPTAPAAFGWTLVKIVEWAKQFHVDAHFGVPGAGDGIPGAQQRFSGLVLFVDGLAMADAWLEHPDEFAEPTEQGAWAVLLALSDLRALLEAETLPHSTGNRYTELVAAAPELGVELATLGARLAAECDRLAADLPDPTTPQGGASAVQALAWYLAVADPEPGAAAADRLQQVAAQLAAAKLTDPADRGLRLRALAEAWRLGGDPSLLAATAADFAALDTAYDCDTGAFDGRARWTAEQLGGLLGGLNAARYVLSPDSDDIDFDRAVDLLTGTWEGLVNLGGLQRSAPPATPPFVPEHEYEGADLFHRHPAVPEPREAGGDHGVAPVFAAAVTLDPDAGGAAVDPAYDTAGAMHLATEALWFHADYVSGFPDPRP